MSNWTSEPPPPNQPPPPSYAQYVPPPPPKKKRGGKIVLIVALVILVIIVVASLANGGGDNGSKAPVGVTSQAGKKPAEKAPSSADCANVDKNEPCVVHLGKPFQRGKHEVLSGWKIKADALSDLDITGKAKNNGDSASMMLVEIKFLKGTEVVMDAQCSTDQLEPDQVQVMNCLSTSPYTTKYDRITVEASL